MTRRARIPVLDKDPTLDVLAAWPFPDDFDYYISGANKPSEMQAIAERGRNPGVAVHELSKPTVTWIEEYFTNVGGTANLFVDSGAFGEVKFTKNAPPQWPKPISDAEWEKRLGIYERIVRVLGSRTLIVLPDQVAHQQGTLERLERWGERVAEIMTMPTQGPYGRGPQAIMPVQKGKIPMAEFWFRAVEILERAGVPVQERVRPGIPLKKDATKVEDLAPFLREIQLADWDVPMIHFLGRGVFSPAYRETFAAAWEVLHREPGELHPIISSDSVRVKSIVGGREAQGNTPGPYMVAKDVLLALGVTDAHERERHGLHLCFDAEEDAQLLEAVRAGWYDAEVYDSSEEHLRALEGR